MSVVRMYHPGAGSGVVWVRTKAICLNWDRDFCLLMDVNAN